MLSIIIPVYNEEASVDALVARLASAFSGVDEQIEVIFVDDHSSDATPRLLAAACQAEPMYRYLRLSRNSGSHVAIIAGLEFASGDCAVFLAADLQDPPELIPRMLELWREGNHVVWAVREQREGISRSEKFFSESFYWLLNRFSQVTLPPTGADFALLDRIAVNALLASVGASPSLGGAIVWTGFQQAWIPYVKEARRFGSSKWTLAKKLKGFVDAFVSFSFVPMRLMSYAGILMATCGLIYAMVIILFRLFGGELIGGWASLMVVVLIASGIQMLMLGVLGEYLWRTLEESRKRPLYFVEQSAGFAARKALQEMEYSVNS